ncbi:MAG: type II toxin-antitoxin system HigB family toxin [Nitrospirales bacterium]|nr:type II toxin-antitoxin system HigB family toxin [Nitrospirales bacterium]
MRVIAKRTLRDFWERHPQAKGPLEAWHQELIHADWAHPSAIKAQFRSASLLPGNRVVFNVGGNKYRLVVKMNYQFRIVYIRFIGTHQEYDQIDVNTV